MVLSNSRIKKFLIFSKISSPHFSAQARKKFKKASYISRNGTSLPKLKKAKIYPEKNSLYFAKLNFLILRLKNFLFISSQKKAVLIFPEAHKMFP